jgi:hypothetical protein
MHRCTLNTYCAPRHLLRSLWISIPRAEETLGTERGILTHCGNSPPVPSTTPTCLPPHRGSSPHWVPPLHTSNHPSHFWDLVQIAAPHFGSRDSMPPVFGSRDLMAGLKRVQSAFPPCPPACPLRPAEARPWQRRAGCALQGPCWGCWRPLAWPLQPGPAGGRRGPGARPAEAQRQRSAELGAGAQCWPGLFAD